MPIFVKVDADGKVVWAKTKGPLAKSTTGKCILQKTMKQHMRRVRNAKSFFMFMPGISASAEKRLRKVSNKLKKCSAATSYAGLTDMRLSVLKEGSISAIDILDKSVPANTADCIKKELRGEVIGGNRKVATAILWSMPVYTWNSDKGLTIRYKTSCNPSEMSPGEVHLFFNVEKNGKVLKSRVLRALTDKKTLECWTKMATGAVFKKHSSGFNVILRLRTDFDGTVRTN